ncbi:hypothetical protein [Leifsonia sp. C5G2]|uniref:hypothetical protein n=1 Tax=Leifsonia sp. C5G2 TaxID=2735269 RepID=UPI0015855C4A|nr:hypothetical protein [Leifsonia sp. C5G2]NUU07561.1 hypothetical protein [Leifsonia sp. C5G2]
MREKVLSTALVVALSAVLTGCVGAPPPLRTSSPAGTTQKSTGGGGASSPTPARTPSQPSAGSSSAPRAGESDARQACQIVSTGLASGSIGVPADPAALAPATEAAQRAVKADPSWSSLASALSSFVEGATAAQPEVQKVNRDLAALDTQCSPIGAPMPAN